MTDIFNAILGEVKGNVDAIRKELLGIIDAINQNYARFNKDLEEYKRIQEERMRQKKSGAA